MSDDRIALYIWDLIQVAGTADAMDQIARTLRREVEQGYSWTKRTELVDGLREEWVRRKAELER